MSGPSSLEVRVALHAGRAGAFLRAGDHENAYVEYGMWVRLQPASAAASFGQGWSAFHCMPARGMDDDGVAAICVPLFERALSLQRTAPGLRATQVAAAHAALATFASRRGPSEQACQHWEAVVAAAPDDPVSVHARNQLAMGGGDSPSELARAERLLTQALEIDPTDEQTLRNLDALRRRLEAFDLMFHMPLPLPGHKLVLRVHPDDTLREVATRALAAIGRPQDTGGVFIFSGDEAGSSARDGWQEPHETLRGIGAQNRDELMYMVANATSDWSAEGTPVAAQAVDGPPRATPVEAGPDRVHVQPRGPAPPLEQVWSFGGGVEMSAPLVAGDALHAVSADGHLYCLELATGAERWRWSDRSLLLHAPLLACGRVCVLVHDGIASLDAATGRLVGRLATPRASAALVLDERIVTVDRGGTLRALHMGQGPPAVVLGPVGHDTHALVSCGSRIVGAAPRQLWCADLAQRRLLWRLEGRFDGAVPVMDAQRVHVGTFEDGLWCIDAASGSLRWIFAADAWIRAAPCVVGPHVFFGDTAGRFACIDAERGGLVWTPHAWLRNRIACAVAPVSSAGILYVRLDDGVLYALDAACGAELWRGAAHAWQRGSGRLMLAGSSLCYGTQAGHIAVMAAPGSGRSRRHAGAVAPPDRVVLPPPDPSIGLETRLVGAPTSMDATDRHEFMRATLFVLRGHPHEAIAILGRLAREHLQGRPILNNLACAYEQCGMADDAAAVRQRLAAWQGPQSASLPRDGDRFLCVFDQQPS